MGPCPACNAPLRQAPGELGVFACDACGGIWTDHAATQALRTAKSATMDSVSRTAAVHATILAPADRPGRSCPACRATLEQSVLAGVPIDYCATHGTWFDRGEITIVCEAIKKESGATPGQVAWGIAEVCLNILAAFA